MGMALLRPFSTSPLPLLYIIMDIIYHRSVVSLSLLASFIINYFHAVIRNKYTLEMNEQYQYFEPLLVLARHSLSDGGK